MNLKEVLKQKIVSQILNAYNGDWAVLVYDSTAAAIITKLFSKTDILSYNIMSIYHIKEEREVWDFPVIYFVDCNKDTSDIINKEYYAKKYSSFFVASLTNIVGLDHIIRSKVVDINIHILDDRNFLCDHKSLKSISSILDTKFTISYINNLPFSITAINADNCTHSGSLLILDRNFDMFTPLLHFFTFKSILNEIKFNDTDDILFDELKYSHLAEVSSILQHYINKLNKNIEKLSEKKVDTDELGKMVLDAPKTLEIKDAVTKYSNVLEECFKKLDYLEELVEAEQILATGVDKTGKKTPLDLEYFFKFLGSTKLSKGDKIRLLYLLKIRGATFSRTEVEILRSYGFSKENIEIRLPKGTVKEPGEYKYDISRFEPELKEMIIKFYRKDSMFKTIGKAEDIAFSLRKSKMISSKNISTTQRKIMVVYIKNGITIEETRMAKQMSERLGVELFIGSDKILDPEEFMNQLNKVNSTETEQNSPIRR